MNKFDKLKFEEIQILQTLEQTHQSTTIIYLCRYEGEIFVCKAMLKQQLLKDAKSVEHVKNQKEALLHFTSKKCSHICSLLGTYQDQKNIYLYLQAILGLPIHKLIRMTGPLSSCFSQLIALQVGLLIKDFHENGFIYRDIKASNFMINHKGKVKMIDLGKAKKINRERTFTICGTTHAMPPDVYYKKGYSYEFDYYSFGILIYELHTGKSPFGNGFSDKDIIIDDAQKGISEERLELVKNQKAIDLIKKLVVRQPENRLGSKGGFNQILQHPYFEQQKSQILKIFKQQQSLSKYDERFSLYISQIQDFGIDPERHEEITEQDPFFKFL